MYCQWQWPMRSGCSSRPQSNTRRSAECLHAAFSPLCQQQCVVLLLAGGGGGEGVNQEVALGALDARLVCTSDC